MKSKLRFATFLAPNMLPVYEFIVGSIGKKLGMDTSLVTGSSFEGFGAGGYDAGFICGLPFIQLTRQNPSPVTAIAAPILKGSRFQGRPIYYSDVIVRKDSPFQSFADLRGRSWSFNDRQSQSGYGITRYWLAKMGQPRDYFGKVIEAGFHQVSIQLVYSGQVDASAIDCQVLAVELREHPELVDGLRIVDTLGPSTIQPVVAATSLGGSLIEDMRAALIDIGEDPNAREPLAYGFIDKFAAVSDADYDDIRRMEAFANQAGEANLD